MTTNDCITTDATILDRHVALVDKWQRHNDTGNETFTAAEYDELAVIYRHDARELAVILDCKGLDYPVCETCGGDGFVTVVVGRGGWGSWYGPDYDEREEPCPHCGVDAGDDYTDDDLDALYAETMAEAVVA